ncbi:hypothetical protein ACJX0J_005685 [Zea mays]
MQIDKMVPIAHVVVFVHLIFLIHTGKFFLQIFGVEKAIVFPSPLGQPNSKKTSEDTIYQEIWFVSPHGTCGIKNARSIFKLSIAPYTLLYFMIYLLIFHQGTIYMVNLHQAPLTYYYRT